MKYLKMLYYLLIIIFFQLVMNEGFGQKKLNTWVNQQPNAKNFENDVTIDITGGDFEGDYIVKISPAIDGLIGNCDELKKLDIKSFIVNLKLVKVELNKLEIEKIDVRYRDLTQKNKIKKYNKILKKLFFNLDFVLLTPQNMQRKYLFPSFLFLNLSH